MDDLYTFDSYWSEPPLIRHPKLHTKRKQADSDNSTSYASTIGDSIQPPVTAQHFNSITPPSELSFQSDLALNPQSELAPINMSDVAPEPMSDLAPLTQSELAPLMQSEPALLSQSNLASSASHVLAPPDQSLSNPSRHYTNLHAMPCSHALQAYKDMHGIKADVYTAVDSSSDTSTLF
jgi:hypothetical protein